MPFYILYLLVLPIIFIVSFPKKRHHSLPFIIIVLISVLRYDTTTDYMAYVTSFWDVKYYRYDGWFEFGYLLLNKIFSFSDYGFVFVIGLSSIFLYRQIFIVLKKYDTVFMGTLVILLLGITIRFDNIIRQGIAIGIFINSFKHIEKNHFLKYSISVIIASMFHQSALILFIYYFLVRFCMSFKPPIIKSFLIIIIAYFLNVSGILIKSVTILMSYNIIFLETYGHYLENLHVGKIDLGLSMLFRGIIAWFPIYITRNLKLDSFSNAIINMSWISAVFYIIIRNFIVLDRIFEYLYIFQVIAIALSLNIVIRNNRKLSFILITSMFLFFAYNTINYYKRYIYLTVFSKDCKEHIFYRRLKPWDERFNEGDNLNRDTKHFNKPS